MSAPTTTPAKPGAAGGGPPGKHDPHAEAHAAKGHAKHKHEEHEEGHAEEGEGAWLVSYADMMTLLMAFFALMFTLVMKEQKDGTNKSAPNAQEALEKMSEEIAKHFGGKIEKAYDEVKENLEKVIRENGLEAKVKLHQTSSRLSVTFMGSAFFEDGSTQIRRDMLPVVEKMTESLAKEVKDIPIYVEGHTDDRPISTSQYPSNWELSSARAATIVRSLQSKGIPSKRLLIQGYGDSQPLAPNRDDQGKEIPENQAQNRRIVIHMIKI